MSDWHSGSDWSESPVVMPAGAVDLQGSLTVGADATGVVVFAHGSGSSRLSPRNQYVAERLNDAGFGTLLFDLLTEHEAVDRSYVFDIALLGDRLTSSVTWLLEQGSIDSPVGLFGASTGAAAAIATAATIPEHVGAVVSRGGRPDLALDSLPRVAAPTLLIVGGLDTTVLNLNRRALAAMNCPARLDVVPAAGHLFEEAGALDTVATLAAEWFAAHLGGSPTK